MPKYWQMLALAVVLSSGAAHAGAQTTDGTRIESYHRARAVLSAAMRVLGGAGGATLRSVEIEEVDSAASPAQAYGPGDTTHFPTRTRLFLDLAGRRSLRRAEFWFPGGYHFETATLVRQDSGFAWDPLRNRDGTDLGLLPAARAASQSNAFQRLIPNTVVAQAIANAATLRYVGRGEIAGRAQHVVSYADGGGAELTLHFDTATALLTRVERLLAGAPEPAHYTVDYADHHLVSGVQVPGRATVRVNDGTPQEQHFVRITPNASLPDSLFRVPAGYAPPPPEPPPSVTTLGEGAYLLTGMPGGYRSMFVDLGDEVVVLEAPVGAEYATLALSLIERTLPGKPVRTVLVTHHHGDHIAGAAPYAARGVSFVAGTGAEQPLAPLVRGTTATVRTIATHTTIGAGARRIEVYPVRNSHAASMLLFYLPSLRLVFQGDLLTVPDRGPLPPAIAVFRELGAAIDTLHLAVDRIVGVHGRAVTMAELRSILGTSGWVGPDWRDPSPHHAAFVEANGQHLELLDWGGRGTPLLFLPGMGHTAHIFDDLAPRFTDRHRVLALTLRGHGASSAPARPYTVDSLATDVRAAIVALGLRDVTLVGHSLGGHVANRVAALYPSAVSRVIYLDAAKDSTGLAALRAAAPAMRPTVPDSAWSTRDRARATYRRLLFNYWSDAQEADFRAQHTAREVPNMADLYALQDWRSVPHPQLDVCALDTPAVQFPWLTGTERAALQSSIDRYVAERYVPWERAGCERFAREAPRGTLVVVPQSNHYVFLVSPEQTYRAMRGWLDGKGERIR